MQYVIIVGVFVIVSFYIQFIFVKHHKSVFSWILFTIIGIPSVIFLWMNYEQAFVNVQGLGEFLQEYGGVGVIALVLKTGLILTPVFIHLGIILYGHYQEKHDHNELSKMIASDI